MGFESWKAIFGMVILHGNEKKKSDLAFFDSVSFVRVLRSKLPKISPKTQNYKITPFEQKNIK